MKKKLLLILLICISISTIITAQTNKEKAQELLTEAIELMDSGALDESIKLLEKGKKLDPKRIDFPYEIAYAHYKKKEFENAIKILKKIIDHKEVSDNIFQLLGNSYDLIKKPKKALETYKKGMEKFPKSGKFYLESGVIEMARKKYNKAIDYWEKGIKVAPNYSSNYYQLSKMFSFSTERIWTLVYGELFMNLEPGSHRTLEISKLLYKNYQESYEVQSDSTGEFKITEKGFNIVMSDKKDLKDLKKGIFPFAGTYATAYAFASIDFLSGINSQSIVRARERFLDFWFEEKKFHKIYPNKLLTFQRKIQEQGMLEAYTYWLLSEGNSNEFDEWYAKNPVDFAKFADWFKTTTIDIKDSDLYARKDY